MYADFLSDVRSCSSLSCFVFRLFSSSSRTTTTLLLPLQRVTMSTSMNSLLLK